MIVLLLKWVVLFHFMVCVVVDENEEGKKKRKEDSPFRLNGGNDNIECINLEANRNMPIKKSPFALHNIVFFFDS